MIRSDGRSISDARRVMQRRPGVTTVLPVLAWLTGLIFLWPPDVQSAVFEIYERQLVLDPPAGYCALQHQEPRDLAMITLVEELNRGQNVLLLAFAACDDLVAFREGR